MRDEKDTTPYDRVYDDIDSIAAAKTERAVRIREVSVAGLLRMLAHEARLEEPSYRDFVVDPALVTQIAEGPLRDEALGVLRAEIAAAKKGRLARLRYAIVRLAGAEAPEVAEGLRAKPPVRDAVLAALAALPSSPPSLGPLLDRMLTKSFGATDPRTTKALLEVIFRMSPEVSGALLLRALEDDDLRRTALATLATGGAALVQPTDVLVARFDALAGEIEASRKGGLPSRAALTVIAGLAMLMKPDVRLARRALTIFDLTPGVIPGKSAFGNARETVIAERLLPICRLLRACIDELDEAERAQLAAFTTRSTTERFEPACAAWARLPLDAAKKIAGEWAKDELEGERWAAAVSALRELPTKRPDLAALVPARLVRVTGPVYPA